MLNFPRPFRASSTAARPAARRPHSSLRFESLEERTVMASWLGQIGGPGTDAFERGGARDSAGDFYVGGAFTQTADFDPSAAVQSLTSAGGFDASVAKYSSAGELIWARRFGGVSRDEVYALQIDATDGSLYVTGVFQGSANFSGGALPNLVSAGANDAFILKLDPADGTTLWQKRIGGSGYDEARSVAAANGQVYVAGWFANTVDFDPGPGVASLSATGKGKSVPSDGYVLRLTSNGDYVSAWQVGGKYTDAIQNVIVEGDAVYVTGYFSGAADFDPTAGVATLQAGTASATFFASYSPAGALNWVRALNHSGDVRLGSDATSLYLTTHFSGTTVDMDPGAATVNLTNAGPSDTWDGAVANYSKTDGSLIWARSFGGAGLDSTAPRPYVDPVDGAVYIGGYFTGVVDFNGAASGGVIGSPGVQSGLLLKLDSSGNYVNAWAAGTYWARPMAVEGATIYAQGRFTGTAAFPTGGTLTSFGDEDSFIMAFDQTQPAMPLVAAALPGTQSQQSLTTTELQPIVAEAFRRWQLAGVSTAALAGVNVRIADLPGNLLGQASGSTILVDRNAAGWGWFIDSTPKDDSEFMLPGKQGERNRMDLLTVVMHELGHLLGHDHDEEGVMAEALAAGVRRTGLEHDAATTDQVFGQSSDTRPMAWLGAWLTEQFDSALGKAKRRR